MAPSHRTLKFCPRCGAKGVVLPSPKRVHCPHCGFDLYLNVAAAVVALIEDGGRLLVTRRRHPPVAGTWDLPGGFVDPGETVYEALQREILEELHLKISAASYFCSLPNRYLFGGVEYRTLDFAFLCQVEELRALRAADDVAACQWVPLERLQPKRFGLEAIRLLVARYQACPAGPKRSADEPSCVPGERGCC